MIEKISRLLDDDLSYEEALSLLQASQEQPELKAKLKRYAAVSHALKNDDFSWVKTDFSQRIQEEIQQTHIQETEKQLN